MSEKDQEEEKYQVIHVVSRDVSKKKFILEPGKEAIMILEEEEYDISD